MGYSYELRFKPTAKHGNADGLSRLPLENQSNVEDVFEIDEVFDIDDLAINNLSNKKLKEATGKDKTINKVIRCINGTWSQQDKEGDMKPFYIRRDELSIDNNCLYWKQRVVIPNAMQSEILDELHQGHLGPTKMKSLARMIMWWPKMDESIELKVQKCVMCQSLRPEAPAAPVHPWEFPEKPWYRLHIDYAGPVHGHY